MAYGQVVIGPPGSGKSTYCKGMKEFLKTLHRKVTLVNLDPANDSLQYTCEINVMNLISLQDVMETKNLGPNGGKNYYFVALIYCMEYLENNINWLINLLPKEEDSYIILDFPGQAELYTHYTSIRNICRKIERENIKLCCVNIVDSVLCCDFNSFISVCLVSLLSMLQLELPHINVLSKYDIAEEMEFGTTIVTVDFAIEKYTELMGLKDLYILHKSKSNLNPFLKKYDKLNEKICESVDDYGLVSFQLLSIENKKLMFDILVEADKANGFSYDFEIEYTPQQNKI